MNNIEKILEKMNYHRELVDHFDERNELKKSAVYETALAYHQGAIDALYSMLEDEENFESLSLSNQYYVTTKDGGIYI